MKVLVVDDVHESLMEILSNNGFNVDYQPDFAYNQTLNSIHQYDGLVVRSKFFIDSDLITKGHNLKFLARAGVGLDIFDLEFARKRGVHVINASGANANSVGEHAMAMLLSMLHHINKSNFEVKHHLWKREENRGEELFGKTVGIIGYGNTGKSLANKLKPFGCNVIAYDKYLNNFTDDCATETSLSELYKTADVISVNIPLTDETTYWCNSEFFSNFAKDIYFINTSRGKIVDTAHLLEFVKSGKIKAASLDVLENENIENMSSAEKKLLNELNDNPNIIITPHVAGWSFRSYRKISEVLAQRIISLKY